MAGSEISSLILTITAIILATIITASMFTISYGITNSAERTAELTSNELLQEFKIIHVGVENELSTNFSVFVMNTGEINIFTSYLTVIFNNNFVSYNDTNKSQYWNVTYPATSNPNNYFDPNELIEIQVFLTSAIGSGSHSFVLSSGGYKEEYWFST